MHVHHVHGTFFLGATTTMEEKKGVRVAGENWERTRRPVDRSDAERNLRNKCKREAVRRRSCREKKIPKSDDAMPWKTTWILDVRLMRVCSHVTISEFRVLLPRSFQIKIAPCMFTQSLDDMWCPPEGDSNYYLFFNRLMSVECQCVMKY